MVKKSKLKVIARKKSKGSISSKASASTKNVTVTHKAKLAKGHHRHNNSGKDYSFKEDNDNWPNKQQVQNSGNQQGKRFRDQGQSKKFSRQTKQKTDKEEGFTEVQEDYEIRDHEPEEDVGIEDYDDECRETRKLLQQQNRKKKKSGGFQSMGLSHNVFTGITRKGYKIPTPIQRKTIPLIMDGKDVVAMARTGSGKTAAFLIPMFERLKTHSAKAGARGLILSPTRELALQTLKFTKEIGKYTALRAAVILGGDKMEDQFEALHENPDIIIATPGRFMHVLLQMELKLNQVEYVVFDEADRLFEMGFQEQLEEIFRRLPETRQTLLFSATLPKLLVEFARAGLHDPTLVRLDVETKLSENLKLSYLQCRSEDKTAVLLHLLRNIIKPAEQTVVFVATKHHVDYLSMILAEAGITCSYSYSALDQTARKINVAKFRNKKTMVLLVTDLAARGIDIPLLDNVINYNFPAKPKLFVHRVGRVARAGQSGTAYSLIAPDEIPYVLDLHLFLGHSVNITKPQKTQQDESGLYGRVPQVVVDDEDEHLRIWHAKTDIESMLKVIGKAYMNYMRSRPAASAESVKRAKLLTVESIGFHPLFNCVDNNMEEARAKLLQGMKTFRPNNTIFEINSTSKTQAFSIMKQKRNLHNHVIEAKSWKQKQNEEEDDERNIVHNENPTEMSTDHELQETFKKVVHPKFSEKALTKPPKKKKRRLNVQDEEHYISYRPKDFQSEKGYSLGSSFEKEAASVMMDVSGDDAQEQRKMRNAMRWDAKKKRYVREGVNDSVNQKRVKTESGAWVKASYKTNIYKDWLERNKVAEREEIVEGSDNEEDSNSKPAHKKDWRKRPGRLEVIGGNRRRGFHHTNQPGVPGGKGSKGGNIGLKRKEEIIKERRVKAKQEAFQKYRQGKKQKQKAIAKRKGSRR